MNFRYEVKFRGIGWRPVDRGYILSDGTLRWEDGDGTKGIAESFHFRFTEETVNNPRFVELRWLALDEDARTACQTRRVSKLSA